MNKEQLKKLQTKLATQVIVPEKNKGYRPKVGDIVFGLDIQYEGEWAFVAIDVQIWFERSLGIYLKKFEVEVDYHSGYFAFREGPILLKAIEALEKEQDIRPDLVIVDGHGLAHPRKFGVACWLGIHLDVPTIGCAKRTLVQYDGVLGEKRGDTLDIMDEQEIIIGKVLRTQKNVKPIFVSVGHKINLERTTETILKLATQYRNIEPIRRADKAARDFAKERI